MIRRFRLQMLAALLFSASLVAHAAPMHQAPSDLLIFAASSLQTALDELAPQIQASTNVKVRMSYAASSTLARQIESGAPAGLFISADLDWMDYVAMRKLIKDDTRVNLLGNSLVLIAPATTPVTLKIAPLFPLAKALGAGRLAVANTDTAPAGKYARAALISLGVWDSVSAKLAPGENVRAALLLVSRGEAPLGVVYRTDALAEKGVTIVDTFPATSHPPIVYPAAVVLPASAAADRVLAFLKAGAAKSVFLRQGFRVE